VRQLKYDEKGWLIEKNEKKFFCDGDKNNLSGRFRADMGTGLRV
jgi:hypothetical protein